MYVVLTPVLALALFRIRVRPRGVGRRGARDGRARAALGRARRLGGRRPARARGRGRLLAADRADGAVRAALRRDRVHARRDAGRVRRPARRSRSARGSSRCRTAGRSGARSSSPASSRARSPSSPRRGRSAGRVRRRRRSPSRSSRCGRRSSASRSPATGSAASPGSAASVIMAGIVIAEPAAANALMRLVRRPRTGMTAVLLALASAALFGGMTVAVRIGLRGGGAAGGAALATVLPALGRRARCGDVPPRRAPLLAVPARGAARSRRLAGALHARGARDRSLAHLGHGRRGAARRGRDRARLPRRAARGAARRRRARRRRRRRAARRRARAARAPARARASLYAAGAATLFATRDNVVRALHGHASPETAAAATLVAGTIVAAVWTRRPPTTRELRRLAPAGRALRSLATSACSRRTGAGGVTVVSPLVATESLWGVALSALLFAPHRGDGAAARASAPLLVVAGGALIGATR